MFLLYLKTVTVENQNQTLIDTHAHANRYWKGWHTDEGILYSPTDAVLRVAQIREEGIQNGLSPESILGGMALTGHDTLDGVSEAMEAGEQSGVIVVPGAEITCKPGKWGPTGHHLVVLLPSNVALDLEGKKKSLPKPMRRGPGYVAEFAHDLGGVVIAAHPRLFGDKVSLSFKQIRKRSQAKNPARRIDAMETVFPSGLDETDSLRRLARELGLAEIGSSDSHRLKHMGIIATRFTGLPENYTSDDVLTAIRKGNTEPVLLRQPDKDARRGPFLSLIGNVLRRTDPEEAEQIRELERQAA